MCREGPTLMVFEQGGYRGRESFFLPGGAFRLPGQSVNRRARQRHHSAPWEADRDLDAAADQSSGFALLMAYSQSMRRSSWL